MSEIDLVLGSDPGVLADARGAVDGLAGEVPPGVLDDLRLVLSELVSNALRHAGTLPDDPIEVVVDAAPELIRGRVTDRGRGFVPPSDGRSMHHESGWGLYLVGQLVSRWGVRSAQGRTTVWFEIDR